MAPTVKQYQGGRIASPQSPASVNAAQSGLGDLGQGLNQIGQLFYDFEDEVDTADAKVADSQYAKTIQNALYADQTGFMYSSGKDAISRRAGLAETLRQEREKITEGLSPRARARAEGAIEARYSQTLEAVNRHAMAEGKTYLNDAASARISMFASDAIYKPEQTKLELQRADQEIADMARRNGWSPEVTELERRKLHSQVHGGIVQRLANADAASALQYLQANRDDMNGEDVAKMEGLLAPMVKEQRGRRAGAAAAMGGISPEYMNAVRSKESGGNDAAKNPLSSATGRYQIIDSTWAGLVKRHPELGLTIDGRGDPAQQELAMMALTKESAEFLGSRGLPATGTNLYAAHFLGAAGAVGVLKSPDSAAMADIVPPSVISANPFLRNMTVAGFKAFAAKGGGGDQIMVVPQGIDGILNIADPDERASALNEYNLRSGIDAKRVEAQQAAAQDEAFRIIEAGGNVDDISLASREALGMESMGKLRTYSNSYASGQKIKTDDSRYVELWSLASTDPEAFARIQPLDYRNDLDDSDFQEMVKKRSEILEGARKASNTTHDMTLAEASSAVDMVVEMSGVNTGGTKGRVAQSKLENALTADLMRWQSGFVAQEKRKPTPQEINTRVRDMAVGVTINPPGINNEVSGPAVQINFEGQKVNEGGRIVFKNPIPIEKLAESEITIGDVSVPPEQVSEFIELFILRRGYQPTPRDVIDGLIATGIYTQ